MDSRGGINVENKHQNVSLYVHCPFFYIFRRRKNWPKRYFWLGFGCFLVPFSRSEVVLWFYQFLQANARIVTQIRPHISFFAVFPFRYSFTLDISTLHSRTNDCAMNKLSTKYGSLKSCCCWKRSDTSCLQCLMTLCVASVLTNSFDMIPPNVVCTFGTNSVLQYVAFRNTENYSLNYIQTPEYNLRSTLWEKFFFIIMQIFFNWLCSQYHLFS